MQLIKRTIAIILFLAVSTASLFAQTKKVANYFIGKPGTDTYKSYSFWVTDGKPSEISLATGANRTETKATYNGKATYQGKTCFKMTAADKKVYYVYPIDTKLAVVNAATKKIETFTWEYEGPVDGVGTFCQPCAQDEKESMNLMKGSYLK
ncbi:hypothetical protein [Mucilaginibacter pedocola]|nr:hypothetical protein [Mucilaginibacter pedocola]